MASCTSRRGAPTRWQGMTFYHKNNKRDLQKPHCKNSSFTPTRRQLLKPFSFGGRNVWELKIWARTQNFPGTENFHLHLLCEIFRLWLLCEISRLYLLCEISCVPKFSVCPYYTQIHILTLGHCDFESGFIQISANLREDWKRMLLTQIQLSDRMEIHYKRLVSPKDYNVSIYKRLPMHNKYHSVLFIVWFDI